MRACLSLLFRDTLDLHRSLDDVLQRRQMREEIEALEDHTDLGTDACDVALSILHQFAIRRLAIAYQLAIDIDAPAIDLFEMVDAAQERRLARATWPDNDYHLAALHP